MKKSISLLLCVFWFSFHYAQQWNQMAFNTEEVSTIVVHPQNPSVLFATTNYCYKSIDAGITWDTVASYSFSCIKFFPEQPDTLYATYGTGSYSDGIYLSTDCGNNWAVADYHFKTINLSIPRYPPGIIIAGSDENGVIKSINYGWNWQSITANLPNHYVKSITHLNPYPADSGQIFIAGTANGIFYYYYDQISSWRTTNIEAGAVVKSFATYHNTSNVLWAAIDQYNGNAGVYKSTDYGKTWQLSLLWDSMSCVLVNQQNANTIFVGNQKHGVKVSYNGGQSWKTINNGLQDSSIICLAQSPNDTCHLYAGTKHGLYHIEFPANVPNMQQNNSIIKVFPNPAKDIVFIPSPVTHAQINIYNALGKLVYQKSITATLTKIAIDQWQQGVYFVIINYEKQLTTLRFLKQ